MARHRRRSGETVAEERRRLRGGRTSPSQRPPTRTPVRRRRGALAPQGVRKTVRGRRGALAPQGVREPVKGRPRKTAKKKR